ncbi:putative serine/threonine-protein kinase abkC [Diplonema papillatum]|nr:putative serine/threonine-protein kinase abkC [Diplonema papillatum]
MRSRALVWGRRLVLGGAGLSAGAYTGFYLWVRSYDPGTAGPPRHARVLVDETGQLIDPELRHVPQWQVYRRLLHLILLYLPLALTYPIAVLSESLTAIWQSTFLRTVQYSGPAFIKLAQWLATRRDLLDPSTRTMLAKLFDQVDAHSIEYTLEVIGKELGNPYEIFEWIEPQSVGSGSIGQVHKAKLKDGPLVAVKVCHPLVRERIALDFHVLNLCARFCDWAIPSIRWVMLPHMAISWTTHLAQQIDLRIEAENLEFFLQNFKGCDTDRFATFPTPIKGLATAHVLVETFVEDATTASDEYLRSLPQELRTHLAEVGMDTYMKFLLRDNWLHGDLHPGNIMIQNKPSPGKKWPVVTLVDCGLCQDLSEEEVEVSRLVLQAFAYWNDRQLTEALWRMGSGRRQRPEVDFEKVNATFRDVFDYYRPCKGDDSAIVGRLLEATFDAVRVHKLQLEPGYTSLLFGVLVQENFIMTLDGNFNIIKRVVPWLAGQGIMTSGMVKNYTDKLPAFLFPKHEDRKSELGPELEKMGLLRAESGNHHVSWDEERKGETNENWKRGILEARP